MAQPFKVANPELPATPWGYLPPSMRLLLVTTSRRGGAWLAESLASDSACQVTLFEAHGAAAGLRQWRNEAFDGLLISHDPPELDAFDLLDALRAGGSEVPLVVLGQASPQELEALCLEAGADAYLCVNTATTRSLLWIVARATERHGLIRENRRLAQAERHRLRQEQSEADRLLNEQLGVVRDAQSPRGAAFADRSPPDEGLQDETFREASELAWQGEFDAALALADRAMAEISSGQSTRKPAPISDDLRTHYRELLKAHVIMGSGNLASEMATLAELLDTHNMTAPETLQLHLQSLEELLRGLGTRSARHIMTRADLLVVEVLVHLAERYRQRYAAADSR
jgi:CheY-like chemotaxis protein